MTVGLRLQQSEVQSPPLIAWTGTYESPDWSISPLQSSALSPDQALGHRGMSLLNALWYDATSVPQSSQIQRPTEGF